MLGNSVSTEILPNRQSCWVALTGDSGSKSGQWTSGATVDPVESVVRTGDGIGAEDSLNSVPG